MPHMESLVASFKLVPAFAEQRDIFETILSLIQNTI